MSGPFRSVAEVISYKTRHEDYFGFAPAAVAGTEELRADAEHILASLSANRSANHSTDFIAGVFIMWPCTP